MIDRLMQASEGKKHLIFDFDETIFWIHPDRAGMKQELYAKLSEIDEDLVTRILNSGIPSLSWKVRAEMIKKYGNIARKVILKVCEKREQSKLKPSEKNQSMIDFIHSKINKSTMHLWSSNHTATFLPYIEKFQLSKSFSTFVGMDTVELLKQYPDGFYYIYQKYGESKKDYLMIGNSKIRDGGAAEAAGIDYFFVDSQEVNWIEINE